MNEDLIKGFPALPIRGTNPVALEAAIREYFYLWTPIEKPIADEIKFYESEGKQSIVKTLKTAKDAGRTSITVFRPEKQEPTKFNNLYEEKLNQYLSKVEFSNAGDFITDELNKINQWYNECPQIKLLKRWIEFLEKKSASQNTSSKVSAKKEIDKLQWKKGKVLLAYLFNELKNKGFIEDKEVWKKVKAIFEDEIGNSFDNVDFASMVQSYSKNKKTKHNSKGVPNEHEQITNIIEILTNTTNEVSKKKITS